MTPIPWQRMGRDIVRVAPTPWRHQAFAVIDKRKPADEQATERQREAVAEHSPPLTRVADCADDPDAFEILPDAASIEDAIYEDELLRGEQPPPDWAFDPAQPALYLEVNDHGNLTLLLRLPACRLVNPAAPIRERVPPAPYDPDLRVVYPGVHPDFSRISTRYSERDPFLEQATALRALAERAGIDVEYPEDLDPASFPQDFMSAQNVVFDTQEAISDAVTQQLGPAYTLHYDDSRAHIGHDGKTLARKHVRAWPGHRARAWRERVGRQSTVVERIGAYRIAWACV